MKPFVVVVGAGQAGLAAGFHLARTGLPYRILEAEDRIGNSWRNRYASLTLFTPRSFSALPGRPLPGARDGYATRDEFAAYLEDYAREHALAVTTGARVTRLSRSEAQVFALQLAGADKMMASHVIVATGGFQSPVVSHVASGLDCSVVQLDAGTYRDPSQIPAAPVLVVGDGATGRDIAAELADVRPTVLATGKPRKLVPERVLGKSIWWWLTALGLMKVDGGSMLGRVMRRADPFPDRGRSLARLAGRGVRIVPRLVTAKGRMVVFGDGGSAEIGAVVWAIGYRDDTAWVDMTGAVSADGFVQSRGLSPVSGLYFVGRPWQRNRASALIMGAGEDSKHIVETIMADIRRKAKP